MRKRSLPYFALMVAVVVVGCAEEVVVVIPEGHGGLICSSNGGTETCGLWLHDPGKETIREDERLRLIDCSPFVQKHHAVARLRDAVEVDVQVVASFDVRCGRSVAYQAFLVTPGDVGSDRLFDLFGRPDIERSVSLASTAFLSHEVTKEPGRLIELVDGIVAQAHMSEGQLVLKRFIVKSISIRAGSGPEWSVLYDLHGE